MKMVKAILLAAVAIPAVSKAKTKLLPIVSFASATPNLPERLAGLCTDRNAIIVEQDQSHVLCTRTIDGLDGAFAQVLVGNAYSTTPELKVRFSITRSETNIRVQAAQWVETQMAFGQIRRMPLDSKKFIENMVVRLESIGGTRMTE